MRAPRFAVLAVFASARGRIADHATMIAPCAAHFNQSPLSVRMKCFGKGWSWPDALHHAHSGDRRSSEAGMTCAIRALHCAWIARRMPKRTALCGFAMAGAGRLNRTHPTSAHLRPMLMHMSGGGSAAHSLLAAERFKAPNAGSAAQSAYIPAGIERFAGGRG